MRPVYNRWMEILELPSRLYDKLWEALSEQFEPSIIKRERDGSVKWEQDVELTSEGFEGRKFAVRGWASSREFDDYGVDECMEYKPEGRTSKESVQMSGYNKTKVAGELVRVARVLLGLHRDLQLGSYESREEVLFDLEQKLSGIRYVGAVTGAREGLHFDLEVMEPAKAAYQYTRGGWVSVGVKMIGVGVEVILDGDVPYEEYEYGDSDEVTFVSHHGIRIEGRRVFRLVDRVEEIVEWIDGVMRKKVGSDLQG